MNIYVSEPVFAAAIQQAVLDARDSEKDSATAQVADNGAVTVTKNSDGDWDVTFGGVIIGVVAKSEVYSA